MVLITAVLAYVFLSILFGVSRPSWGMRSTLLRSAITWALICFAITELVSAFHVVNYFTISVSWALVALVLGILLLNQSSSIKREMLLRLPIFTSFTDLTLLISVAIILTATFLVAIFSAPTGYEVQHYHLSRVLHWIQNQTIEPYITGVEIQNSQAPFSEYVQLHFHLLTSGDNLANLVQWFSMLGSLVVVSLITKSLGGNHRAQLISVVFAATLPVGIAQSSIAETDYLVSFFILVTVHEFMCCVRLDGVREAAFFASGAGGLAILTKLTAPLYLLPFVFAFGVIVLINKQLRRLIPFLCLISLVAIGVNIPHFSRVYALYNAFSAPSMVREHVNEQWDLRAAASNILRHAALHAGTEWPTVNDWVYRGIVKAHILLKQPLVASQTTLGDTFQIRPPRIDDIDGNPLHALMLLVFFGLLVTARSRHRYLLWYSALTLAGFLIFAIANKWQIFGNRYHLPFFLLAAPTVAIVLTPYRRYRLAVFLALFLMVYSFPWAFRLNPRPLLPMDGDQSILRVSKYEQLMRSSGHRRVAYESIAKAIQSRKCKAVGIMISGAYPSAEYPFWVMLGAPESGVILEWIVSGTPSSKYEPSGFQPCAVICDPTCPTQWSTIRGMPLVLEEEGMRLYAK